MKIVRGISDIAAAAGNSPAESSRGLIETTVPASIVDEIVGGARIRGHDAFSIRARCGIAPVLHRGARITLTKCVSLVRTTQLATRDTLLGFGRHAMPGGMFSAIAHASAQCRDLQGGIDVLDRLYGVYLGGSPFRRVGGRVMLQTHSALQAKSPLFALCLLFSCYRILCWLAGRRLVLYEMGLASEPHPLRLVFSDLFGCALGFGAPHSYFALAEYDLQSAVVRGAVGAPGIADSTLTGFMRRALERRLEQRIRSVIGDDLSRGLPPFEAVAQRLAMAPRELSRRLGLIGATYEEIGQRLRRDIALALIDGAACSFDEIAERAGFARTATFEREFRDWTGLTPVQYGRYALHPGPARVSGPRVSASGMPAG
jgi:AraC-like DNA-binding protein